MSIAQITHPRFLILMPMGIGDAVTVGLSATDQIIKNEPAVNGNIDVVCNNVQADVFRHDHRINSIKRRMRLRLDIEVSPTCILLALETLLLSWVTSSPVFYHPLTVSLPKIESYPVILSPSRASIAFSRISR